MLKKNKIMRVSSYILGVMLITALFSCKTKNAGAQESSDQTSAQIKYDKIDFNFDNVLERTESDWEELLSDEEYYVLRKKGTERAFSGDLWNNKKDGKYVCAGCGLVLFISDTKFRSGTGWPSFYQPVNKENVGEESDSTFGMKRVEVVCNRCGGHLGHVFKDGPKPTGLRYCINSVSMDFVEDKTEKGEQSD